MAEGLARIVALIAAAIYLLPFFAVVRIGYLSRIGVTFATVFVVSAVMAPLLGLAGRSALRPSAAQRTLA